MGALASLRGNKSLFGGSDSNTPVHTPDSLFSDDIVEVILALSEGPIVGPVDGARGFLVADTPLIDVTGNPNIGQFDLRIHVGNDPSEPIVPTLGGSGASTSVGVALETNTPVTRTGSHNQLDYLEVRLAIARLLSTNDQGEYAAQGQFRVEIKPHSGSVWNQVYSGSAPAASATTSYGQRYTSGSNGVGTNVNPAYRPMYTGSTPPAAPSDVTKAIWFDASANYQPKKWAGSSWVAIGGANLLTGGPYSYWQFSDYDGVLRKAFIGWNSNTAPSTAGQYDIWIASDGALGQSSVIAYTWNGTAWTDQNSWAIPPSASPGTVTISGKTSTTYVKELRFPVDRIDEPYDIRVTKLSPVNTTNYFFDISWESFQELSAATLQFDGLAIAHLTVKASDQFSSVPEFTSIADGRTIKVPTNYDPINHVYTGLWDGTFKIAYSNNPAWVAYDLVDNDRYGMAAYYTVVLDKYATYAFGQHCDAHGFTYNDYIQDPRDLNETIDYICGIAGGRFVDQGDGFATIVFDADDQPAVHLFTPENVLDGVFSYAQTDVTSRKNDITVSFVNEGYNWVEDRRRVTNTDEVSKFGRNPEEFVAVGCINEEEAVKRARLRLLIATTEKTVATFKTNRQGLYIRTYDIVLVGDPDSGFGLTGRVQAMIDSATLQLRDPIYIEAGLTYTIRFSKPTSTGLTTISRVLTNSPGSTTVLHLDQSLTDALPEFAVFTLESTGIGAPRAFRVTNVEESEDDPDNVQLTCMEVNRNKWAIIDGTYTPPEIIHTGQIGRNVEPIGAVRLTSRITSDGKPQLIIDWDPSVSPMVRFYRVYQQINGGPISVLSETRDVQLVLEGLVAGSYTFSITAVNLDGLESAPKTFSHDVTGAARIVVPPSNLHLADGEDANTYRTRSPSFFWDASSDPFFANYQVRIYNNGTNTKVREVSTTLQNFIYGFETNAADFGGTASRTFRFEVRAVDTAGNLSEPAALLVTNTAPTPPSSITLTPRALSLYVDVPKPAAKDYAGTQVWASKTAGFTPGSTTLVYDGPDTTCWFEQAENEVWYLKVAFYDDFDKQVTVSNQFTSQAGKGLNPGTVSYEMLTDTLKSTIDEAGASNPVVIQHTEDIQTLQDNLYGSWVVKIQTQTTLGGTPYNVISGFGLAQSSGPGGTSSDFVVQADNFSVVPAAAGGSTANKNPVFTVGTVNGIASVGIHGNMILDGAISARSMNVTYLSAVSANLGRVTAGVIQSTNGNMVIDLTNGTISIFGN